MWFQDTAEENWGKQLRKSEKSAAYVSGSFAL